MKWFFNSPQDTCFAIHESKFPMITRGVEKNLLTLPEGWSDWKLFLDASNFLKILIGDHDHVFANYCNLPIISKNNTSHNCLLIHGFLSYSFP